VAGENYAVARTFTRWCVAPTSTDDAVSAFFVACVVFDGDTFLQLAEPRPVSFPLRTTEAARQKQRTTRPLHDRDGGLVVGAIPQFHSGIFGTEMLTVEGVVTAARFREI
jgi:hypothetical protein